MFFFKKSFYFSAAVNKKWMRNMYGTDEWDPGLDPFG